MPASYPRYRAVVATDPTDRFTELVAQPAGFALDEACVLVAAHARPGLDVEAELARLDELAAGFPGGGAVDLGRHLCHGLGFAGDRTSYHDPRNSLLPDVLDRRLGIPISLAILAMEVGRRVGVPVDGIGMPGHFLVRDGRGEGPYLDLFAGARELDREACRSVFAQLHPRAAWSDAYLEPVGPHAIVARVLANLANAYRRSGDRPDLAWSLALRLALPGPAPRERRELAVLLGSLGRFAEGADVLEGTGDADDRVAAQRLRARLN
jgi:regulator of sirC expression with transglutaminase-like and TPR domain